MQRNNSKMTKKIVLMGLDNVGKTSIVLCLKGVKNLSAFSAIKPTRGFEINTFNTLGSDFNIWDFGGQERFRPLLPQFISGCSAAMYVFDLLAFHSLENLQALLYHDFLPNL